MNKYEELYKEILTETRSGQMSWKQERKDAYPNVVLNSNYVRRLFSANFQRDGDDYVVLLTEKKYEDPEFDLAFERFKIELLVLDEGELIIALDDSTIDVSTLADLVETKSDRARKLFRM